MPHRLFRSVVGTSRLFAFSRRFLRRQIPVGPKRELYRHGCEENVKWSMAERVLAKPETI